MVTSGSQPHGSLADVAERRMREWAVSLELQKRVEAERAVEDLPRNIHPFISISRQCGAGGLEMAQYLASKLGWELLDKQILQYIAQTYNLPEALLKYVDEAKANWLWDVFGRWLDRRHVTQTEYVSRLGRVLILAAQHGPLIVVGRGAQFILPRDRGILVRVVAPKHDRIQRVMRRQGLSREDAENYVATQDRDRDEFVQRYFHRDAADPLHYDLVVNTHLISPPDAGELVLKLCHTRFGDELKRSGR